MEKYWVEFATLAVIHFLAVVAPGPDLALTINQSVRYGRVTGIWTALGIGAGLSVHVIYTVAGVGLILSSSQTLFLVVKLFGAAYLVYLAFSMLRTQAKQPGDLLSQATAYEESMAASFRKGFLTNALNPKATLFFVAIFTTIVSSTTPLYVQMLYGVWMCFVITTWFSFVATVLSIGQIRRSFLSYGHWFDRVMGFLLVVLAVRLAFSPFKG